MANRNLFMLLFILVTTWSTSALAEDGWKSSYPAGRVWHAMAPIGGDRAVLFGGFNGYVLSGAGDTYTWVYDPSEEAWVQKSPTVAPPARVFHAMAYIGGDQVVLFGGGDPSLPIGGSAFNDTWVYDLSEDTWVQKSPAVAPPASPFAPGFGYAMAYIGGDQVLLFGLDTWVYDLSEDTWVQKSPAVAPPTGVNAMAYIGGDQVLLFGENTWVYDLSEDAWVQKSPAVAPPPRSSHAMAYIGGDQVVLFGGQDASGNPFSDTWVYDLSEDAWVQKSPAVVPPARAYHAMASIGGDRILLFGGTDLSLSMPHFGDTWVYHLSGDAWVQRPPAAVPPARAGHAMASVGGDQVVLFGGGNALGNLLSDTWVYDLSEDAWGQKSPAVAPQARVNHSMAYIGGDQVVLFGGGNALGSFLSDTWVYDLSEDAWVQKSPAVAPQARSGHAIVSVGGDKVVLFGGGDTFGSFLSDTWVYDLSENTWVQKSPAVAPPARFGHAMALIGGNRAVLFGGWDGPSALGDTWVYDLSEDAWVQKSPAAPPPARLFHAMAPIGGNRAVLFGGSDHLSIGVTSFLGDTWVYDLNKDEWVQKSPAVAPTARYGHAMAHVGADRVVLFGGFPPGDFNVGDTWAYQLGLAVPGRFLPGVLLLLLAE